MAGTLGPACRVEVDDAQETLLRIERTADPVESLAVGRDLLVRQQEIRISHTRPLENEVRLATDH